MPIVWVVIPPCAGLSAARLSKDRPLPPARWDASRRELLATDENVEALVAMNGVWIDKVHDRHPPKMIILDMDSSVWPDPWRTRGNSVKWSRSAVPATMLFLFNQFGDLERCSLRFPVMFTVPTDGGMFWSRWLRYKERKVRLYFRGDAALASPEIYRISRSRGITLRHPTSKRTRFSSGTLPICLRDLSARPPDHVRRFHASFSYHRRIVEQEAPCRGQSSVALAGELVPRVFIGTNLSRHTERVRGRCIITVARRRAHQGRQERHQSGPVCHVASSATMPFGSSFTPLPTIWATS